MSVSRTPSRMTPGRRKNAAKENVYFNPGKQGRKTGITISDNGLRDENGFEHASHLFSSPQKAQSPANGLLGRQTRSSLAPGASELQPRKTPRLPPPKSQTPRHTHIGGSPVRHSSVKPGSPLRVMRDEDETPIRAHSEIIHSIERDQSPVILLAAMGSRTGKRGKSLFEIPEMLTPQAPSSPPPGAIEEVSQILDTHSDNPDIALPDLNDSLPTLDEDSIPEPSSTSSRQHGEPNTKRKRGARRSDMSTTRSNAGNTSHISSEPSSSAKRRRTAMGTSTLDPSPGQHKRRSGARHSTSITADEASMYSLPTEDDAPNDDADQVSFPSPLPPAMDDGALDDRDVPASASPAKPGKRQRDKTAQQQPPPSAAAQAKKPTKRQTQRATTTNGDARSDDGSDDATTTGTRRGNVRLRSATPFEDEGAKITRSGRASIKPLAYWRNETYVYRAGELEGVIRAQEVEGGTGSGSRRRKTGGGGKRRKGSRGAGEGDEEEAEEEEHEDLLPEAWEGELGVITGPVKAWDEVLEGGGSEEVEEDIAFASSAIRTHRVPGNDFRYAKVISSDWFGAGVVELPPGGSKKVKNARAMQMAFFVHEGKVSVDVAGMGFGVTQGGMWHVPRGNNYAITNDSTLFPAKIFFAQGCEWDASKARAAGA